MGSKQLIGIIFALVATGVEAETTRLDSEFFAFNLTKVVAIQSQGVWKRAPTLFQLGMKANQFIFDASLDKATLPPLCQGVLTTKLPKKPQVVPFPTSILDGDEAQYLALENDNCAVRIWMAGPRDGRSELGGILPPDDPRGVSFGLIELRKRDKPITMVFAVLVEDTPIDRKKR